MHERKLQAGILALVAALHVGALMWLAMERSARTTPRAAEVRVELQLIDPDTERPSVDPVLRIRPPPTASATARPSSIRTTPTEPVATNASVPASPPAAIDLPHRSRLIGDDGRPRISPRLVEELDAARGAELAARFHHPEGDTWVLRERRSPLEYQTTRFAELWLPESMNPVEEACWRNRALAFVLSIVGSVDCANPGGPPPRPTPAMIYYGKDSVAEILRKNEEWARYEQR